MAAPVETPSEQPVGNSETGGNFVDSAILMSRYILISLVFDRINNFKSECH
jgi:hypothetical protein